MDLQLAGKRAIVTGGSGGIGFAGRGNSSVRASTRSRRARPGCLLARRVRPSEEVHRRLDPQSRAKAEVRWVILAATVPSGLTAEHPAGPAQVRNLD
jgi:hypothetical protein